MSANKQIVNTLIPTFNYVSTSFPPFGCDLVLVPNQCKVLVHAGSGGTLK